MLTKLLILAIAGLAIVEARIFYKVPWIVQLIPNSTVPAPTVPASTVSPSSAHVVITPSVSSVGSSIAADSAFAPSGYASWADWEMKVFWTTNENQIVTPIGADGCTRKIWREVCNICTCNTQYKKCTRIDCSSLPAAVQASNAGADSTLPIFPGSTDLTTIGQVYRFGSGFAVRSSTGSFVYS